MSIDMKKAHLNSVVKPGDGNHYMAALVEGRNLGMWWKLKKWLSGMRPAARAWEEDYTDEPGPLAMAWGKAAPICFSGEGSKTWALVHGDDFAVVGPKRVVGRVKSTRA